MLARYENGPDLDSIAGRHLDKVKRISLAWVLASDSPSGTSHPTPSDQTRCVRFASLALSGQWPSRIRVTLATRSVAGRAKLVCGRLPHGDKETSRTLRHGRLWRPSRAPGRSSFERHAVCGQGPVDMGRDLNWIV